MCTYHYQTVLLTYTYVSFALEILSTLPSKEVTVKVEFGYVKKIGYVKKVEVYSSSLFFVFVSEFEIDPS